MKLIIIILLIFTLYFINTNTTYLNEHLQKYKKNIKLKTPYFPIDIVYTWAGEKNTTNIRQSNFNELKYSLRSVKMFLPWVNNIYILMNPPKKVPSWMKEGQVFDNKIVIDNIIIIDHNDVFKNDQDITNSNLIETYVPHIKGLSEHFIYFNDDFFILKPLEYTEFFTEDGKPLLLKPKMKNNNMVMVNKKTDLQFKLPEFSGFFKHIPITMKKSAVLKYQNEYSDYIDFVRSVKKREKLGCSVCIEHNLRCPCQQQHYPIHMYMYKNNIGVYSNFTQNDLLYFDMSKSTYFPRIYKKIFEDNNAKFLCLNNATKPLNKTFSVKLFNNFGDKYWYKKQLYEK